MSNTVIIVLGGQLGDWALRYISEKHTLIGADSGAAFLVQHGFIPDVAIGDFDSVSLEQIEHISKQSRQMISCDPIDKDYTDSEMAFRLDVSPVHIVQVTDDEKRVIRNADRCDPVQRHQGHRIMDRDQVFEKQQRRKANRDGER